MDREEFPPKIMSFIKIGSPAHLQLQILFPPFLLQPFCFVQVVFHLRAEKNLSLEHFQKQAI